MNAIQIAGPTGSSRTQELSVTDHLALGRRMMRLHDCPGYTNAVLAFRRTLELDPACAAAWAGLAETYSFWGFRVEITGPAAQDYYDSSLECAEESVRLEPQSPLSRRALSAALQRGKKSDCDRSRAEVLLALRLGKPEAETWHQYWRAFGYNLNDPAIEHALELDAELSAVHNDLGAALCAKNRHDEALPHFQAALKVNPRNPLYLYNFSVTLDLKGLTEQACAVMRRALRLHPDDRLLKTGWESMAMSC